MGKNMTTVLATATSAKGWVTIEANRANKNAAASLEKAGQITTRTKDDGSLQIKAVRATSAAGDKSKSKVKGSSTAPRTRNGQATKMTQAIEYVNANGGPSMERKVLVDWLQTKFKMSPAGASTYAHLARKKAAGK